MKETRLDQITKEWADQAKEKKRVEQLKIIAQEWFVAFNAKDINKLLDLYHDDAVHFSPSFKEKFPETKGIIKGKNDLRDWWQGAFDNIPGLYYEIISLDVVGDKINMQYKRTADGKEPSVVNEFLKVKKGKIVESAVESINHK